MNIKPYIVGICGGSASGKTYLLEQLLTQLPTEKVTLMSIDNYYIALKDQEKDEVGMVNWDHPKSLNLEAFVDDVRKLMMGESIMRKEFTFNHPPETAKTLYYSSTPILLLEGLFIFYKHELNQLMDLKIFVEADEHIRLSRRLERDYYERGYTYDEVLESYNKYVAPMYEQYVEPTKKVCDMIIQNNQQMDHAAEVLVNHLKTVI